MDINIQGFDLDQKEETLFAKTTIFGERLQSIGLTAFETEDDMLGAGIRFKQLLSDMQSFHDSLFRKDSLSDRTGIPGTGFPIESFETAVA
jgi:hypothetical protein